MAAGGGSFKHENGSFTEYGKSEIALPFTELPAFDRNSDSANKAEEILTGKKKDSRIKYKMNIKCDDKAIFENTFYLRWEKRNETSIADEYNPEIE